MPSGIYAVAHIGNLKLYVSDASRLHSTWPLLLAQLNSGTYPNTTLQTVWNAEGGKRHFTFHTRKDLAQEYDIIGIEQLTSEY
ncbi:MAG TPA: hypothetical protein DCE56_40600 [Cyanobacteria bacterium UBA8553]|nr:hypothetical protein [Cyanobacteria bacterium UBA8553]HAJ63717.1 hypothetical protein [Cyanobacteria bacterium UBA8543]